MCLSTPKAPPPAPPPAPPAPAAPLASVAPAEGSNRRDASLLSEEGASHGVHKITFF